MINSSKPVKILIIYATAGAGHLRAAHALFNSTRQILPSSKVECIDILDFTPSWLKQLYPNMYLFIVRRLSFLWSFGYSILDVNIVWSIVKPIRRIWNRWMAKSFISKRLCQVNTYKSNWGIDLRIH